MKSRHTLAFIISALMFLAAGLFLGIHNEGDTDAVQVQGSEDSQESQGPLFADVAGSYRPEFSLPDISGVIRSISEWDGMVVLINFWATWCLPCLTEIPELLALQEEYGEQGFQVIGIALQKPAEVTAFVEEHNMSYPIMAGEAEVIVIAESYGNHVGALPYTAIIDRDGIISFTRAGPISRDEVEKLIPDLLERTISDP